MQAGERDAMLWLDERHWWYRGRRRMLHAVLSRLDLGSHSAILDAGCGSGRTLDELARYGAVTGVDVDREAVAATRRRGHARVYAAHVEHLPFPDASFDLITCLDVIEHTASDVTTLRELRRTARPGARLVVTVPAYQSLWSGHDDVNHHFRRYRAATLRQAAALGGWGIERTTYFNSILLPPAAAVRLARRVLPRRPDHRSDLSLTPRAIDALLALPMYAEAAFVRRGGALPAGLSLLAVLVNRAPALGDLPAVLPEVVEQSA